MQFVSDLFSSGTPVSSINKTDRHDIAEILLKVVLSTINQSINISFLCRMQELYSQHKKNKPVSQTKKEKDITGSTSSVRELIPQTRSEKDMTISVPYPGESVLQVNKDTESIPPTVGGPEHELVSEILYIFVRYHLYIDLDLLTQKISQIEYVFSHWWH
jgi:hypothetical protein